MPSVLIAGASGLVGNAALERFLSRNGWTDVVAVSRRKPEIDSSRPFRRVAVDLRDRDAAHAALSEVRGITHVVYAALYEKPGLIPGWQERDQMETNLAMLQNYLEPVLSSSSPRHVTIMQGTKAYGIHVHPMPTPARERAPRDEHENFYWLQEDYLKEKASEHGFAWTILRPQLIIGRPWGVAMNLAPIIGVYAAICREACPPPQSTSTSTSPTATSSSGATSGREWPKSSEWKSGRTIQSRWSNSSRARTKSGSAWSKSTACAQFR
jgi:nucleoside-diphosphate-sugar epimerase